MPTNFSNEQILAMLISDVVNYDKQIVDFANKKTTNQPVPVEQFFNELADKYEIKLK